LIFNTIICIESSLLAISAFIILFFLKNSWRYIAFVAIFSLGISGFYEFFYYSGLIVQYPRWIGLSIPLPWLTFPAVYILMRYLTNKSFLFQKKHFLHFLPFAIRFITAIPVWTLPMDEKYNIVTANYPNEYSGNLKGIMNFYLLAIYMNIYYFAIGILLYKKNRAARKKFPNRGKKPVVYTYYFIWFVSMVASLKVSAFGVYAANNIITRNGFILLGFVFLSLVFILLYFPVLLKAGVFLSDDLEIDNKYLKDMDIASIKKNIAKLMEKEKVYLQENLSLHEFASQLNLTLHQISKYLNTHHGKRYQDFINHYRVEHAKALLKTGNCLSVKNVANQSGFASYNPFYQAFKKETGMSPDEWLKSLKKS